MVQGLPRFIFIAFIEIKYVHRWPELWFRKIKTAVSVHWEILWEKGATACKKEKLGGGPHQIYCMMKAHNTNTSMIIWKRMMWQWSDSVGCAHDDRIQLLPSQNAWCSFIRCSFLPVVFDMRPSSWLTWPLNAIRAISFWSPSSAFMPVHTLPPVLPTTPCCDLHFSSHSLFSITGSKLKKRRARPRRTGLLLPNSEAVMHEPV